MHRRPTVTLVQKHQSADTEGRRSFFCAIPYALFNLLLCKLRFAFGQHPACIFISEFVRKHCHAAEQFAARNIIGYADVSQNAVLLRFYAQFAIISSNTVTRIYPQLFFKESSGKSIIPAEVGRQSIVMDYQLIVRVLRIDPFNESHRGGSILNLQHHGGCPHQLFFIQPFHFKDVVCTLGCFARPVSSAVQKRGIAPNR